MTVEQPFPQTEARPGLRSTINQLRSFITSRRTAGSLTASTEHNRTIQMSLSPAPAMEESSDVRIGILQAVVSADLLFLTRVTPILSILTTRATSLDSTNGPSNPKMYPFGQ